MRELLERSYAAAVASADPLRIVGAALPAPPPGRPFVVGAGKAAAAMAAGVEAAWPGAARPEGLVITRYGHGLATTRIRVVEAGHPLPDSAGEAGARAILQVARALGPDDLLLALLSGGGSALLNLPAQDLTAEDLKEVTAQLLRCGADIREINTVRKHLSAIQGGRLAAACRARTLALIISDVAGDEPTDVASGPCAPDPSTYRDALDVLARYGLEAPAAVRSALEAGARGERPETPKPGDAVFARVENRVIASSRGALEAATTVFRDAGIEPAILGDSIAGEAREVAKVMAALVREVRRYRRPFTPPVALLSGGECTVTLRSAGGRGGRCAEFLLALAIELDGMADVHAIAADTDGIDGSEENAGAVIDPGTLARARARGVDARTLLAANDSYRFFAALGALVVTGPTRTNVNDYRAIVVL